MRITKQLGQKLFEAYQELFQAVENGIGTEQFFQLRERFRNLQSEVFKHEAEQDALETFRIKANELYADDDTEIDDNAIVSESKSGAFIEAWLWVPLVEEVE
jgi:hypothetical protein